MCQLQPIFLRNLMDMGSLSGTILGTTPGYKIDPHVHLEGFLNKANIDSRSHGVGGGLRKEELDKLTESYTDYRSYSLASPKPCVCPKPDLET